MLAVGELIGIEGEARHGQPSGAGVQKLAAVHGGISWKLSEDVTAG
jgi:hypothetical protein